MTRTARRRWTRELPNQVDGILIGDTGPVLLHGYDPPAGGKWLDDVIPGKFGAFDRNTGESVWMSPCEIGYGRGFGAGFNGDDEVVVLGPSLQGHSIARMSVQTGELLGAREIEAFDEAVVQPDVSVCVTPRRVCGILTTDMVESWVYAREGERYHMVGRAGDLVFVVYSVDRAGKQGVLCLHAETGEYAGSLMEPRPVRIHSMAVDQGAIVLVVGDIAPALPPDALREHLARSSMEEDPQLDGLSMLAVTPSDEPGQDPLWFEVLPVEAREDLPEVSIAVDRGKLYLARGAILEVRDALTGRSLGELTVPGLDEFVAWRVANGAGLLAEETRVSIFEVPD